MRLRHFTHKTTNGHGQEGLKISSLNVYAQHGNFQCDNCPTWVCHQFHSSPTPSLVWVEFHAPWGKSNIALTVGSWTRESSVPQGTDILGATVLFCCPTTDILRHQEAKSRAKMEQPRECPHLWKSYNYNPIYWWQTCFPFMTVKTTVLSTLFKTVLDCLLTVARKWKK